MPHSIANMTGFMAARRGQPAHPPARWAKGPARREWLSGWKRGAHATRQDPDTSPEGVCRVVEEVVAATQSNDSRRKAVATRKANLALGITRPPVRKRRRVEPDLRPAGANPVLAAVDDAMRRRAKKVDPNRLVGADRTLTAAERRAQPQADRIPDRVRLFEAINDAMRRHGAKPIKD